MSEASFSISFSDPKLAAGYLYWIRLEKVELEDDTMALSEVADIVDLAFEVDVCGAPAEISNEDPVSAEDLVTEIEDPPTVDFVALARYILGYSNYDPCKINPATGEYISQVKVFLSHVNDPDYKFIAENGTVLSTEIVTELIEGNTRVSGRSVTLEEPIAGPVTSSIPIERIEGSTLFFAEEITASVALSYMSQHYLVTIEVNGVDGYASFDGKVEPATCRCLGFFRGVTNELLLTPPQEDEDTTELLGCNWAIEFGPDGSVQCYEAVTYYKKCWCSKDEVDWMVLEVDVPCPEWSRYTCPAWYDTCRRLVRRRTEVSYVDCGEIEGEVYYPEYYEEVCCQPWPFLFEQPRCSVVTMDYLGGKGIEGGVAKYRAIYGYDVSIVPVGPKYGVCGELIVTQKVVSKDCCDEVLDIEWDYLNSVEVISDFSSGVVQLLPNRGISPFSWSVRGDGFFLDEAGTIRDADTEGRAIRIFTQDACGTCSVYVTDGCSSVSEFVMAADGVWTAAVPLLEDCPATAAVQDGYVSGYNAYTQWGTTRYIRITTLSEIYQAYGIGNTTTYCHLCTGGDSPTIPAGESRASCLTDWYNAVPTCENNWLGGEDCVIHPHYCVDFTYLGTYCYNHKNWIQYWIC